MNEELKRGPGRPRKTPEEPMENIEVKVTAPEMPKKAPETGEKWYKFKLLKGTNFPKKDEFKIIDLDEDGNELAPREPGDGEFGPQSKIWPGKILLVNAWWAKRFKQYNIADRVEEFE
jgi:hypothetical protein